ncbi:MAG: hypothetical protein WBF04_21395 [Candidatus Sulfotelmatobacter sp.]
MTLKKGLNDHEIGKTIDYALQQPCVRGVTFQPIQDAGRLETWVPNNEGAPSLSSRSLGRQGGDFDVASVGTDPVNTTSTESGKYVRNFNPAIDRLTLTEVRRKILEQTNVFRPEDIIPVPCHPDSLAMAYALKLNGKVTPLTSMIPPEVLINGAANTILYEQDDAVRENLFKLFATNHSPRTGAGTLRELLCCLPKIWIPDASDENCHPERSMISREAENHAESRDLGFASPSLTYENIFRIIIMQFIDAHSFDVRSVKKTCVHIVHPDGRLIPFDTYNLFYRDNLEVTRLSPLRTRAASALAPV